METMKSFFGGWTYGFREGKNLKYKIILTIRIIRNSFRGLWLWRIKSLFVRH